MFSNDEATVVVEETVEKKVAKKDSGLKSFMISRNEARVKGGLPLAYSQADIDKA